MLNADTGAMDELMSALRSIAEPSRLRILYAVQQAELTVGEICRVVDQSQPRVSRHLKLLLDAGLVRRNAQGTSAYFRLAAEGTGGELAASVLALVDPEDKQLGRDRARLDAVRQERADVAAAYFASIAADWDEMRHLHVADEDVEQALLDEVADIAITELLDVGTGTGRVLELFAPHVVRASGIDLSGEMLAIARSRLDTPEMHHCAVRKGSAYDIDAPDESIDVAVLHHVLHFLDDPAAAIAEAARVLRSDGRLVIVDFASHDIDRLHLDFAHRHLGFDDDDIQLWAEAAGLDLGPATRLPGSAGPEALHVVLWSAADPDHSRISPQKASA